MTLIDNEGLWIESVLKKHISSSCFTEYINSSVLVIYFSPTLATQSVESVDIFAKYSTDI